MREEELTGEEGGETVRGGEGRRGGRRRRRLPERRRRRPPERRRVVWWRREGKMEWRRGGYGVEERWSGGGAPSHIYDIVMAHRGQVRHYFIFSFLIYFGF